jgi:hypothetical protein
VKNVVNDGSCIRLRPTLWNHVRSLTS